MGVYYSLNPATVAPGRYTLDAVEAQHALANPPGGEFAPSLWCGAQKGGELWAPFSPLQVQTGFLLERRVPDGNEALPPAMLEHKWGRLLRAPHHHFEVEIAPSAEVFVVVACDPRTSHLYAALMISGSYQPHTYWRLGHTTDLDLSQMKFPLTQPERGRSPMRSRQTNRSRNQSRSGERWRSSTLSQAGRSGVAGQQQAPGWQSQVWND